MSQTELVQAAQRGERITKVQSEHVLFDAPGQPCEGFNHHWRTIVCNNDRDVCECSRCGAQSVMSCNFDEDMS